MANIIKPTREILVESRIGFRGLIGWELLKDGIVVARSRPQPNLIVDAGLNGIGAGLALDVMTTWAQVGESSIAPAVGQVELLAPVGGRTNNTGGFGVEQGTGDANEYVWRKVTRLFLEAEANGNLTEIGFFQLSAGGVMFNRQLLLDDVGAPTTITKTASHQLRVTFELRMYKQPLDTTQSGLAIGGNPGSSDIEAITRQFRYPSWAFGEWDLRAGAQMHETTTLPAWGGSVAGNSAGVSAGGLGYGGAGSFYYDFYARAEPGQANFATGVGQVSYGGISTRSFVTFNPFFTSRFTPKIMKTDVHRLQLNYRIGWGRH